MRRAPLFAFCSLLLAAPAGAQDNPAAVLSAADVHTYRSIFDEQAAGHTTKADAAIKKIADPVLMGYVLEQRYLGRGVAKFGELNSWLAKYGDLAGAERIYKLALKRKPRKLPAGVRLAGPIPIHWRGQRFDDEAPSGTAPQSAGAQRALAQLRVFERDGRPDRAEAMLTKQGDLPGQDFDRLAAYVAAAYLAEAKDADALRVAEVVIEHLPSGAPLSHWAAGLAEYRLGHFENSARHFEAISETDDVAARGVAGSAFWAARAWMRAGYPGRVMSLYAAAASEPNTFYGMLATRLVGQDAGPGFVEPSLDGESVATLLQNKAARRAVALWQIGQLSAVESELARAFGEISPDLDSAFAGLARTLGATSLELRAAETSANRDLYLTSLYPVPAYAPKDGYQLDRAMLLAFARQESRFVADAQSKAGARGVMQIMPATAVEIAHDPSLARGNKARLDDPAYSMMLGQDYLRDLLDRQNGNLLALAAAYNAGAGNLSKWLMTQESNDDPLLFIESLPAAETRDYVKRVMMNFWMYRKRLGQPVDGLDETAAGNWPTYRAVGTLAAR